MKKEKTIRILLLLLLIVVGWFLGPRFNLHPNNRSGIANLAVTGAPNVNIRQLVQKTNAFDNPLDPETFWYGKPVWLDINAMRAAHKLGRLYPPIPFGDKSFSSFSEMDIVDRTGGSEAGSTVYHLNEREKVFWNAFERTHPIPPEEIERKQIEIEREILDSKSWKGTNQKVISGYLNSEKDTAISDNYPPEAFTDDALHWTYVILQNDKYASAIRNGQPVSALVITQSSMVDPNLLTAALGADQTKLANAWKVSYLRRLKMQNTDQSYLNAYLHAWNLSSNDISGSGH